MENTESSQERSRGENASGRIPELDGLRGVAILSVLVWHYFYFHPAAGHHPVGLARQLYVHFEQFLALGWSGVDLFFVLSGFLIGGILLNARNSPSYFRTFYLRRFFRIVPIYYAWLVAYLLLWGCFVAFARNSWVVGRIDQWPGILAHFVFLQNLGFVQYSGLGRDWLPMTWSLAIEEQFYLVSPFIIRRFSERFLQRFLLAVMAAAPLLRLWVRHHYPLETGEGLAYMLMPCRADSLALGMLIALSWRKQACRDWTKAHSRHLALVLAVLLAGVIVLTLFFSYRYLALTQIIGHSWLALFYGGLLTMALARPETRAVSLLRSQALRNWGRVSYCVYLIHQAVNAGTHALLGASEQVTDWKTLAAPALAVPLTYALASLSWAFFEEKMLRIGQQYKY